MRWPLTIVYVVTLLVIAVYGLHRYGLVWKFLRHRKQTPVEPEPFESLPRVTVQLPMFNEAAVAERIIDAACKMDYPRGLLQIQVIDDSTDACAAIAENSVRHRQAQGVDIEYLHRTDRVGYKAGALADAMDRVTGEFVAIFDADFIPPANFLQRTIHHFTDENVAMVQTAWGHLNREQSWLTRCQSIVLDGHFLVEHPARHFAGHWFNFNGTAGVWRKSAIEDADGWQGDTLTEDVDLSYRAQMKGWRFIYRPDIVCPAEVPASMTAFKSQQHRWSKGAIQVAKKLLPAILKSNASGATRLEAFFHLTNPIPFIAITMMALLLYPTIYVNLLALNTGEAGGGTIALLIGLSLFALGTASAGVFYMISQRVQQRSYFGTLLHMPLLMAIGIGIALNNAKAVFEALFGYRSPFVRTPKRGDAKSEGGSTKSEGFKPIRNPTASTAAPSAKSEIRNRTIIALELLMGLYTLECCRLSLVVHGTTISLPFLALFAIGYLYVGIGSLIDCFGTPSPHVEEDANTDPRSPVSGTESSEAFAEQVGATQSTGKAQGD